MSTITATTISVPIHRVYEMRGTLFHEVQGIAFYELPSKYVT